MTENNIEPSFFICHRLCGFGGAARNRFSTKGGAGSAKHLRTVPFRDSFACRNAHRATFAPQWICVSQSWTGAPQLRRDALTRAETKQKYFSTRKLSSGGAHFRVLGFDHGFVCARIFCFKTAFHSTNGGTNDTLSKTPRRRRL